ncbi:MAG TPA: diguanylate cyclase [Rhodocyclaceae bacterium]|nr:diguanylate cyclase [Rhodocyclaceae bacterium]
MRRRLLLALALLAALPAWALQPVTLQLNWKHQFQFAGYYAAIEKGYYREAGFDVSLREAQVSEDPVDAVLQGRAAFGVAASELVVRRIQGAPVVALAAILQHSPLVLLAHKADGIDLVQELSGKRVMVRANEAELFAYLAREQLPLSALTMLPHTFDTADLIQNRVEAMSGYSTDEPFLLRQAGFAYAEFTPRSSGIDFYGDTLFTSEEEIRRSPEAAAAFRDASLKGWRYAMDHPAEIADLILAKYGKRHSREHLLFEAAEMTRLMQPELVEIGHMARGRWRHIADTYAELGMVPKDASLEGFLFLRDTPAATVPLWVLPGFVAGSLLLLIAIAVAVRFIQVSRQLEHEARERQNASVRLRATQRDMMALIDATPGAAMLIDLEGRILAINLAGATRFRGSKAEITGRNIFELSTPALGDNRRRTVAMAAAEKRLMVLEDRRANRDLRNTIVPVEDEDGQVRRVAVFSEDVTEKRRAEEDSRLAYAKLQAQLEEIRQLQSALQDQATRDALTGLYNRRYLDETLERELARAHRERAPLSLVMIDLDHFKEINDTYGHRAGDEMLRMMARLLQADVRHEDVPCRYGGEEFLILLPKMTAAAAHDKAERWRDALARMSLPFDGQILRMTASIGVASYPDHGSTPDELTRLADEALYRAKRAGRNRVAVAREKTPAPAQAPEREGS